MYFSDTTDIIVCQKLLQALPNFFFPNIKITYQNYTPHKRKVISDIIYKSTLHVKFSNTEDKLWLLMGHFPIVYLM